MPVGDGDLKCYHKINKVAFAENIMIDISAGIASFINKTVFKYSITVV